MPTITDFTARPYAGEADLPALAALFAAAEAADQLDDHWDAAELRRWFTSPGVDPARDIQVWADSDGRLVGFAWVGVISPDEATSVEGRINFRVHPTARSTDLGGAILAWASDRLRMIGQERGQSVELYARAHERDRYQRAVLEQHGFAAVRTYLRLACALDQPIPAPQLPAGFTLRHVANEAEVAQWVAMFNLSFIDHWNFQPMPVERRLHWLEDPNYRPEQDLIIVAPDGTFAAFCYCAIHAQENAQTGRHDGWIHVLGTRRGYRKLGLGRAILLAGLRRLQADGATAAILNVDAENPTGALGLYESAGFYQQFTLINYCKDLA
jgi:mycothiol synthase